MKGFSKTRTPNMWRNNASGRFYAVARGPGKLYPVAKSLKTDKESVAKLRLNAAVNKIRTMAADAVLNDNLTLGQCAAIYLGQKFKRGSNSEPLKPLAVEYRKRSITMIRAHCSKFDSRLAQAFTLQDCHALADRLRSKYSPRRFNGALWALRGVLGVAVDAEVITKNPALKIQPARIVQKVVDLPAEEKIEMVMDYLRRHRQHPTRAPHSFDAFLFCSLMLESGQRPGAIALLRPEHVDFRRGTVDWVPFKHSHAMERLPMTRRMRAIFRLLRRRKPAPGSPLLPIHSPTRTLRTTSRVLGVKPAITPHSFRHIWSTRMAELGMAPALVAKMRRDKDGGTMFLRTYVHPRPETLKELVAVLDRKSKAHAADSSVRLSSHATQAKF